MFLGFRFLFHRIEYGHRVRPAGEKSGPAALWAGVDKFLNFIVT
jgi:hypothetical protein